METQQTAQQKTADLTLFKAMWPQNKTNLLILRDHSKKILIKLFIDLVLKAGDALYAQIP